jgi:hypothetical protein
MYINKAESVSADLRSRERELMTAASSLAGKPQVSSAEFLDFKAKFVDYMMRVQIRTQLHSAEHDTALKIIDKI